MRIVILVGLLFLLSCQTESVDYKNLSWEGEQGGIQAVVEIPAGTNLKLEYNAESGSIEPDQEEGADRYINFLPYPGNYGFVPGEKKHAVRTWLHEQGFKEGGLRSWAKMGQWCGAASFLSSLHRLCRPIFLLLLLLLLPVQSACL